MNELMNWIKIEVIKQSKTELTEQQIEKIITDIVTYNFPICLNKYLNGKDWKLTEQD